MRHSRNDPRNASNARANLAWTKEEDAAIKAAYYKARFENPGLSVVRGWTKEVAKELGRSEHAVSDRMQRLLVPPAPPAPEPAQYPVHCAQGVQGQLLPATPAENKGSVNATRLFAELDIIHKKLNHITRKVDALADVWQVETQQEATTNG